MANVALNSPTNAELFFTPSPPDVPFLNMTTCGAIVVADCPREADSIPHRGAADADAACLLLDQGQAPLPNCRENRYYHPQTRVPLGGLA
jgi:hypothetical protein